MSISFCTSSADIKALRLRAAKEVYVLGEVSGTDDKDSYHDVMNMECLKLISSEISDVAKFYNNEKEDNRLVCRVMFEYQSTFNVFQITDIDVQKIKFLPFNYYEKWAQNVLVCQELSDDESDYRYLPLEGINGIKYDDPHHVHLVVIGMSRMGIAMAIEAAHLAHYPNFEEKHIKTKITLIDKNAAEEKNFFMGRFKALFALSDWKYGDASGDTLKWIKEEKACAPEHLGGDFVDLEWEFLSGSAEDTAVRQYLSDVAEDKNAKLTVAVCLPENSRAVAAAAYLPDKVYESDSTLQVLVYQRLNAEIIRQIGENNSRYHNKMKAFGMSLGCYDSDLVELCECLGREIGKAYGEWKLKNVHPEVMSGGKSKSAKMWSNQYNIYSMWTKFRCVTTSDGKVFNPLVRDFADFENGEMKTRLALTEHNRWVAEQLLLRYRPLTEDEQDAAKSPDEKNRLKVYCFAHLDICSNEKLKTIDHLIPSLDTALVAVLPQAYKDYMCNEKGLHTAAHGRK